MSRQIKYTTEALARERKTRLAQRKYLKAMGIRKKHPSLKHTGNGAFGQ